MKSTRRHFCQSALTGIAAVMASPGRLRASAAHRTTQNAPEGFFTLDRWKDRWFFKDPEGRPFFSVGLNHIDSAPLRYPENGDLWRRKFGNSMERWLRDAVRPDLIQWGFNSVGWVQEVVNRSPTNHRHSANFSYEEYQWLGLPSCHLLPFADFHQWEVETRHPDLLSQDFADWCDYVARTHCARLADDPKLIGYFYIDCPTWIHIRPLNAWKGPIFDPAKLKSDTGRQELFKLATRYYQVTHDAIRRYDRHHLILGDRYEASAPIATEVIEAAKPFVYVLSFQDFRNPVGNLATWHRTTGKPVLWADGSAGTSVQDGTGRYSNNEYQRNDGEWYSERLNALRENPGCVGAHLCGAYLRNRARKRGLLDEQGNPDAENVSLIRKANAAATQWAASYAAR
jgi:hypothetical protein